MDKVKMELLSKATSIHKKIYPCAQKTDFEECFTTDNNQVYFWYNTEDHSTHVLNAKITKEKKMLKKQSLSGRPGH
ncbi:MAG TPA: hypothetical protein VKY57_12770 [Chitinispirillaceae bacterium]|nr:hypothetical protein [Chitinispirillaceae bacterium]